MISPLLDTNATFSPLNDEGMELVSSPPPLTVEGEPDSSPPPFTVEGESLSSSPVAVELASLLFLVLMLCCVFYIVMRFCKCCKRNMDSTTTSADTNNNLSHSSDELPHDNDVNEEVHRVSFNGPSFASCPVNLDLAGVEVIEMNEMKNIKVTGKKQEDKETGETIMMENIEVMTNENQNKKEDLWELDMLENGIITEKNKHEQERKGQDEIVYVNESALEIKLSKEDERQVNKDEDVKTQMEASEGCHTVHGEENEVKKGADVTDTTETGDMEEDESERNRDLDFPKEISDREHLEPFEEVVEDDSSAEEESESSSDPGEHPLLESPSPEPIHSASDHDEHPLENPSAPEPIHNASDPDEHPLSAAAPQQEPIYYASAGGCVTLTYHPPPTSLENVPVFPDDLDDEDGNVLYCPVELQEGRIVARLGPDRVLIIDLNDDVNPDEERRTDTEEGEPQDQGEDDEAEDNEDDKEHEEDQDDETSGSEEENSEDDSDRAQDEDEEDSQKEDEDKDDESDETSGSEDDNDKAQDEDEEDNQKEDENKDDEKDETNGSEDENTENDNDKGQNEDEEDHQKEDDEHNWCKKREEDDSEDKTAEDTEAKEHAEGEGEDEEEGQNVFFSCDDLTDDDVLEEGPRACEDSPVDAEAVSNDEQLTLNESGISLYYSHHAGNNDEEHDELHEMLLQARKRPSAARHRQNPASCAPL